MKEKIFGILAGICIFLLACSEREDNESVINNSIVGRGDKVTVNLSLSAILKIHIDDNTDYRPMSSRAEGNVRSRIANNYKCLVMKEIESKWYVDTLTSRNLTDDYSKWDNVDVTDEMSFKDLQLTLRPGHYRVLVVLNPRSAKWNPDLVPGAIVKGETDTVAHAYTYIYQMDSQYANVGKRQVDYELFAGTAEFTVEKTSDLHSEPVNGNTHITFTRKVAQMRFLLKDHVSVPNSFNFIRTQHTVHATLIAAQPDMPFCDGLDCWGNAYYNHKTPTTKLAICTDLDPEWRVANTGDQYKIISRHVTIYSPFIFADDLKEIPYQLDNIKAVGQSGSGGFVYVYPKPIQELILKNNSIQPVVFQTTGEVDDEIASPQLQVTLEYLKEESSKESSDTYFDAYYECNIP